MGGNPGKGFEKVAEAITKTAPEAMRPAEATAEGLASVMRSGSGKKALQASRQGGLDAIEKELAPVTQANRTAAGQGMTGPYKASAEGAAADPAGRFKALVQELADANAAGHSPVSGEVRGGMNRLAPLRDAAAIREEIQGLLSPEQLQKFQGLQGDYAKGSALSRLFKPKARGADVLHSQEALQTRAQTMQDKLDPEVLKAIFRGGQPLVRDTQASIPLGIGKFGRMNLPGTIMAGPPGNLQELLMKILGGGATGLGGYGAGKGLEP
jgi:hypothetical protein